jgi:DNA-binding transcriptional MerR regulator
MVQQQHISLSLEQFAAEVALTLEHYNLLGVAHDSRVSPVPDGRTIRYYTTLGLLDRPWMEGRQARYGKRHLLQLIAIKALQGRGLPLSEVQSRIFGLTNEELESLLTSMAVAGQAAAPKPTLRSTVWHEIIVEPGLKFMVEGSWLPQASLDEIQSKVSAAIAALAAERSSNGGI